MSYQTTIPVRFGDVDHAGIVFYPQFFIYFHTAFEDFFNNNGFNYHRMFAERKIGFPTVHIETDYRAPLRYGDALEISLSVKEIGKRSAIFGYDCVRAADGVQSCAAKITTVCVELAHFTSVDIPDDLRAMFEKFRG